MSPGDDRAQSHPCMPFCAEHTSEHLALYEEGREPVFWNDTAECAGQCMALLADVPRRKVIAEAGHAHALRNGHYNQQVIARILDAAIRQGTRPLQDVGT